MSGQATASSLLRHLKLLACHSGAAFEGSGRDGENLLLTSVASEVKVELAGLLRIRSPIAACNTAWQALGWGRSERVSAMAVISLKLTEELDAQLTAQAQRRRLSKSELVRRALTAFLQSSEQGVDGSQPLSAADLLADLVGCCEDGPADLASNPAYLSEFGMN